jgi:hypothetical protein
MRAADSGPEKAGVGGSTPSLATILKAAQILAITKDRYILC